MIQAMFFVLVVYPHNPVGQVPPPVVLGKYQSLERCEEQARKLVDGFFGADGWRRFHCIESDY